MKPDSLEVLGDAKTLILAVTNSNPARVEAVLDDIKQETIKLKSLEADLAATQAKAAALAEERKAFQSSKVIHAGEVETAKAEAAAIKRAYEQKAAQLSQDRAVFEKVRAEHTAKLDELDRFKSLVK